jgi:hypothetical protein
MNSKLSKLGLVAAALLLACTFQVNAAPISLSFSGVVAYANDSTGPGINYSDAAVGTVATGFINFDTDIFDTTNFGNLYGPTNISGSSIYYGPLSVPGSIQPSPLPLSAGATVGTNTLLIGPNDYYTGISGSISRSSPVYAGNDASISAYSAFGQRSNGMGPDSQTVWLFTYDETGGNTSIFDFGTFLSNPTINWNAPGATTGANIFFSETLQYHLTDVRVTVTAVPEPETYALMLAGLGLIGSIARRRKAKQPT